MVRIIYCPICFGKGCIECKGKGSALWDDGYPVDSKNVKAIGKESIDVNFNRGDKIERSLREKEKTPKPDPPKPLIRESRCKKIKDHIFTINTIDHETNEESFIVGSDERMNVGFLIDCLKQCNKESTVYLLNEKGLVYADIKNVLEKNLAVYLTPEKESLLSLFPGEEGCEKRRFLDQLRFLLKKHKVGIYPKNEDGEIAIIHEEKREIYDLKRLTVEEIDKRLEEIEGLELEQMREMLPDNIACFFESPENLKSSIKTNQLVFKCKDDSKNINSPFCWDFFVGKNFTKKFWLKKTDHEYLLSLGEEVRKGEF